MPKMISYAQNGEDVWIVEHLPLPDKGFYVDIGCGHPFTTSNTAFLRDRKWEGLAVDANPMWANEWANIPAFQHALIASGSEARFFIDPENLYTSRISSIGLIHKSETIENLLERFGIGKFDFLSIDTEGTELEILETFDFNKHRPGIAVVEYNAAHMPLVDARDSVIPYFMEDKGYCLVAVFPPVNMVFAR